MACTLPATMLVMRSERDVYMHTLFFRSLLRSSSLIACSNMSVNPTRQGSRLRTFFQCDLALLADLLLKGNTPRATICDAQACTWPHTWRSIVVATILSCRGLRQFVWRAGGVA